MGIPDKNSALTRSVPRLRSGKVALAGAAVGALLGIIWGWIDYGAFEIGYISNHVIGGAVIGASLLFVIAVIRNWTRRNPM